MIGYILAAIAIITVIGLWFAGRETFIEKYNKEVLRTCFQKRHGALPASLQGKSEFERLEKKFISRSQRVKIPLSNLRSDLAIEIPVILLVVYIVKIIANREINISSMQQIMIAISLIALVPAVLEIRGRKVSEKILREVPLLAIMGIAFSVVIETLKPALVTSIETLAAFGIIIFVFAKWHIYKARIKEASASQ
ncbi:MAG: hypothetical protein WC788_01860 [Candidatus Paceibacterota bacterium]